MQTVHTGVDVPGSGLLWPLFCCGGRSLAVHQAERCMFHLRACTTLFLTIASFLLAAHHHLLRQIHRQISPSASSIHHTVASSNVRRTTARSGLILVSNPPPLISVSTLLPHQKIITRSDYRTYSRFSFFYSSASPLHHHQLQPNSSNSRVAIGSLLRVGLAESASHL